MFWRKNKWLLLPACVFLYACPFESPAPMDEKPLQPVDTSFMGYWYGIIKDHSDVFGIEALDISQHSDSLYQIIRYGKSVKGNMIMPDTAYFTGYHSDVLGRKFMNIESSIVEIIPVRKKAPEIRTTKIYYLALMELHTDTLTVKMITDNFAGKNPGFKKAGDVRQAVTRFLQEGKNMYDDLFKLSYRRWPRPK